MAKTVIWNRTEQDVLRSGGRPIVFPNAAAADTHLARPSFIQSANTVTKPHTGVIAIQYDKIVVF